MADENWEVSEKEFVFIDGEWVESKRKCMPEKKKESLSLVDRFLKVLPVISILIPLVIIAIQQKIQYNTENKSAIAELYQNISNDISVSYMAFDTSQYVKQASLRLKNNYTPSLAVFGTKDLIRNFDTLLAVYTMNTNLIEANKYLFEYTSDFNELNNYLCGDSNTTWIQKKIYLKNAKIIDSISRKLFTDHAKFGINSEEFSFVNSKYFQNDISSQELRTQTKKMFYDMVNIVLDFANIPSRLTGEFATKEDSIFLFKDSRYYSSAGRPEGFDVHKITEDSNFYQHYKSKFDSSFLSYLRN